MPDSPCCQLALTPASSRRKWASVLFARAESTFLALTRRDRCIQVCTRRRLLHGKLRWPQVGWLSVDAPERMDNRRADFLREPRALEMGCAPYPNILVFIASPDPGDGARASRQPLVDARSVSQEGAADNEKALAECYGLSPPRRHGRRVTGIPGAHAIHARKSLHRGARERENRPR